MTLLINYANKIYRKSQKLNSKTGLEIGMFDKVISYMPEDIDNEFYQKNKKILNQKIGNGYWLWKPYFIKKSLALLDEDDFLFYCDSGAYFINPITPLTQIMIKTGLDIMSFELTYKEKQWTKRDAFLLMDCDSEKFTETKQRLASFSTWRNSEFTLEFVNEWLHFSQDERIITDLVNQMGYTNYDGFIEHRWDQSIFSMLTKKYDLPLYRDPSQYGNGLRHFYSNSEYDQLIVHTRKKNRLRYLLHLFGWRQ